MYKFAEHVFVGVSTGYSMVLIWFQVIVPNLIEKVIKPEDAVRIDMLKDGTILPPDYLETSISLWDRIAYGEWPYYIFAILGFMMLFKISKKLHWLSRWPLAYVIGAFAGIQIIQATQGALVPQLKATMKDFTGQAVVLRMLDESGALPAGEIDGRKASVREYYREYFSSDLDDSGLDQVSADFEEWISYQLDSRVDSELFESQPRIAFTRMRGQIFQITEQSEAIQDLFNKSMGGFPLEHAFALSSQNSESYETLLEDIETEGNLQDYLSRSFTLECLEHIDLEPWQHGMYTMLNRVWLESSAGRQEITEYLTAWLDIGEAQAAAEAFARPEGQPGLSRLLKTEAFPADWKGNWSDVKTHQIVDSLLKQVNPRPDNFVDWDAGQFQDFRQRMTAANNGKRWNPDLRDDLRLRFDALDTYTNLKSTQEKRRISDGLWHFWYMRFLEKTVELRAKVINSGLNLYAGGDLTTAFTAAQIKTFRHDPSKFMQDSPQTVSNGNVRLQMFINIISNLLVVIGVCTGIFYFFFSKKHTGALAVVSRVGIAFLMMSFGANTNHNQQI